MEMNIHKFVLNKTSNMPNNSEMYKALVNKDSSYEGIFFAAVKTTGIFCRPTCSSRKPKKENVEFFSNTSDAIRHGYRPCKVCNPLEKPGETPVYIKEILSSLYKDPSKKFKDYDLRQKGIEPEKIRRWFLKNHNITFHAFQRMYRINSAFKKLQDGESVISAAYDSGFESLSGFNDSFRAVFGVSPSNSKDKRVVNLKRFETPIGTMFAGATEKGICLFEFTDRRMLETEMKKIAKSLNAVIIQGHNEHFDLFEKEINLYFDGRLKKFTVPLEMIGTDFQKSVWRELLNIPYGETRSYGKQAAALGKPESVRAVANANGMNKISILIPCHRVIGSDGQLTGYGGGLWRKKWLLDLEMKNK